MARASLLPLIARLRVMVSDPEGPTQLFDNDTLQGVLDANRTDAQVELEPQEEYASGGVVVYKRYTSPVSGAWESDCVLQNYNFDTLTPASSELLIGVWHFSAHQPEPVYARGKVFDLNAAAADVLEMKLAQLSDQVDFSVDGLSVSRSQQSRLIEAAIARYRAQVKPMTATLYRSDTQ